MKEGEPQPKPKRESPLVSELRELFVEYPIYEQPLLENHEKIEQAHQIMGNNRAVMKAILAARKEEQRIKGIINLMDGIALDDEEDRQRLIDALYGKEDSDQALH